MSTVLQFKSSARSGVDRLSPPRHACEIVIFPGVRIERHAEAEFFKFREALLDTVREEADTQIPRRR